MKTEWLYEYVPAYYRSSSLDEKKSFRYDRDDDVESEIFEINSASFRYRLHKGPEPDRASETIKVEYRCDSEWAIFQS